LKEVSTMLSVLYSLQAKLTYLHTFISSRYFYLTVTVIIVITGCIFMFVFISINNQLWSTCS